MSKDEKKKKRKNKEKIVSGLMCSTILIVGGIVGGTMGVAKIEEKNEENEEEKKKRSTPNQKSQSISKIDLQTTLTQDKRNLGIIATNGQPFTVDMIKAKLSKNIQNEVDININANLTSATISAKACDNAKYKGTPVQVTYTLDTKQILHSALTSSQRNLGIIATNGQPWTVDMIKAKLPKNIKNEVDISINSNTKATISSKESSTKYKGNIEVELLYKNPTFR